MNTTDNFILSIMSRSFGEDYANEIYTIIKEDVLEDLATSADEDFNSDDVAFAVGRAIISRISND